MLQLIIINFSPLPLTVSSNLSTLIFILCGSSWDRFANYLSLRYQVYFIQQKEPGPGFVFYPVNNKKISAAYPSGCIYNHHNYIRIANYTYNSVIQPLPEQIFWLKKPGAVKKNYLGIFCV